MYICIITPLASQNNGRLKKRRIRVRMSSNNWCVVFCFSSKLALIICFIHFSFKTLVKSTDEDDYRPDKFTGGMTDQFVFILLTSRDVPPPNASDKFYYILLE